jgi:hypothetical protein
MRRRWLGYMLLEDLAKSRFFSQKHICDNVSAKEEAAFAENRMYKLPEQAFHPLGLGLQKVAQKIALEPTRSNFAE